MTVAPLYPIICTHHGTDSTKLTHTSRIVNVTSLQAATTLANNSSHNNKKSAYSNASLEASSTSFNFASVDDRGLLCFWLLSEADQVLVFSCRH
jgi:hypothetical protein